MPNMEQKDWSDFAEGGADKNGWRPIESAPRDGTSILGWNSEGPEIVQWYAANEDDPQQPGNDAGWIGIYAFPGRNINDRYFSKPQGQPTHYQPLPPPPEPGNE